MLEKVPKLGINVLPCKVIKTSLLLSRTKNYHIIILYIQIITVWFKFPNVYVWELARALLISENKYDQVTP